LGEFRGSRLFMPSTLKLRKMTNERGDAGFTVFTIKPGLVPFSERSFLQEIDEVTVGVSLKADTTNNFSIGGAGLVFQKETIIE
jgi:hypothetical protein